MDPTVEAECPECGARFSATLGQIARGATVECRNGHSIKLEDQGGGARKAVKAMDDLDRALKNFGK